MHMVEHLMRGGHFAAFCTFLAEVTHKDFIKMASRLSRTEANFNVSQDNMLKWVLWQAIFTAAIAYVEESESDTDPNAHVGGNNNPSSDSDSDNNGVQVKIKEECALPYMDTWCEIGLRPTQEWQDTFISKKVRVTRKELLSIMCRKLKMPVSANNRVDLLTKLQWRCFGTLAETRVNALWPKRKFVGISSISKDRRDFVHIHTPSHTVADDGTRTIIDTCWSAQILMFVYVSGFTTPADLGIVLPENCRNTNENTSSVRLALIRWLCPHPDAILRDAERRPVCSISTMLCGHLHERITI